jgi:hypothetical protein
MRGVFLWKVAKEMPTKRELFGVRNYLTMHERAEQFPIPGISLLDWPDAVGRIAADMIVRLVAAVP